MLEYSRSVWDFRYFWMRLVRLDLKKRYRGSVLGIGWSLLHPLAMAALLCLVFHRLVGADIRQYGPYVLTGLAIWNYLGSVINDGCGCFLANESYIRQFPAPAIIYPLRSALAAAFHFLIALTVAIIFASFAIGAPGPLSILSLVPGLILLFVFTWALAIIAGFANIYFRDTQHLITIALQMLFYMTPILYTPDAMGGGRLTRVLEYNPLIPFFAMIREPILTNTCASLGTYLAASTTTLICCLVAGVVLTRCQRELVFRL